MKKSTLLKLTPVALACLTAMSAVQAEDVHKVFGQVNISMDNTSVSGSGLTANQESGKDAFVGRNQGTGFKSNASRIGVMGSMDTGLYDARVTYLAELEYTTVGNNKEDATKANDPIFAREASVGLNSKNAGHIRMGRLTTQYKANYAAIDPWTDHVLEARNGGQQGASNLTANYFNNAIEYRSPSFGGVDFSAFYSVMHDSSEQRMHNAGQLAGFIGGDANGFGVRYKKDGITVAVDTINLNADEAVSGTTVSGIYTTTNAFNLDKRNKNGAATKLTAEYKTKTYSLGGHYEDAAGINHGVNTFAVGTYTIGNTMLTASYGVNQGDKKSVYGEKDGTTMGVGAKYKLNKTANLIAGYSTHSRDTNAGLSREAGTFTLGIDAKFGY
jgi:predicted porin